MPTGYEDRRSGAQAHAAAEDIEQALHEMRDGLTVIHAYAQLLQRRSRPPRPVQHEALLARLEIIERTSMAMERRLRTLDRHHFGER